jgi:hypothetical protein
VASGWQVGVAIFVSDFSAPFWDFDRRQVSKKEVKKCGNLLMRICCCCWTNFLRWSWHSFTAACKSQAWDCQNIDAREGKTSFGSFVIGFHSVCTVHYRIRPYYTPYRTVHFIRPQCHIRCTGSPSTVSLPYVYGRRPYTVQCAALVSDKSEN